MLHRRYALEWLGPLVVGFVLTLLMVAVVWLYDPTGPLPEALNSPWLVIHVVSAIPPTGAFTLGGMTSAVYLVKRRRGADAAADRLWARVPSLDQLDLVSYRIHAFAFPVWTFAVLITGPIWAHQAWSSYWNWDPKEVWAFITWVVYAAYLHARTTAGWRGRNAAILALVGTATLWFNFIGINYFSTSSQHSYAGAHAFQEPPAAEVTDVRLAGKGLRTSPCPQTPRPAGGSALELVQLLGVGQLGVVSGRVAVGRVALLVGLLLQVLLHAALVDVLLVRERLRLGARVLGGVRCRRLADEAFSVSGHALPVSRRVRPMRPRPAASGSASAASSSAGSGSRAGSISGKQCRPEVAQGAVVAGEGGGHRLRVGAGGAALGVLLEPAAQLDQRRQRGTGAVVRVVLAVRGAAHRRDPAATRRRPAVVEVQRVDRR